MPEETTATVETTVETPVTEVTTEAPVTETTAAESVDNAADTEPSAETKAEKLFKQADVDSIVQKRLEREQAKLNTHPALSYVAQLAKQNNMSVEQFVDACRQRDEQAQIDELAQNGELPEAVAKELFEYRKEKETRAEFNTRMGPINDLLKLYPNVTPADVPETVWQSYLQKGIPLAAAYAKYDSDRKDIEIAKLKESQQIRAKNAENADVSPGSVTGQGAAAPDHISAETFEKNKGDQKWIIKNLSKIQESRKKWK
jgi:hypothetical protein